MLPSSGTARSCSLCKARSSSLFIARILLKRLAQLLDILLRHEVTRLDDVLAALLTDGYDAVADFQRRAVGR